MQEAQTLKFFPPWALATWWVAVVVLTGCAGMPKAGGSDAPGRAATSAPPVLRVVFDAPRPLAELLERHLQLARVNLLAGGEPLPEGELDRLIAATPAEAQALLDTEGYFNARTEVQAEGGTPPLVRVSVDPGPRTTVRGVRIDVDGPLAADTARGEPSARAAQQALRGDWPLPVGAPFRGEAWADAKSAALARLRAQGYVAADWRDTEARIDAATQQADLSATVASGPLYRTGGLRIEGLRHHDPQTVRNLAAFGPGVPATEERLLDFQERLQKSDLFTRATVTLAPDPADPGATPVLVRLGEQKLQDATAGLGYSANMGLRGTLEHTHRRLLGRALLARNRLDLAQREQRWEGEISTHTLPGLRRNLVGGSLSRLRSETDTVTEAELRLGRAQDTRRISRLAYVEAVHSDKSSALGRERSVALAGHWHGIFRRVDDLQLPTRGRVWTAQAGAGYARSDPGGAGPFGRLYARLNAYRPVAGWLGQGRIELAQVFSRDEVVVPETLRFRAGGEGSVRGYEYRSLTPQVNGVDVSGRVLFTASAEASRPVLARLPALHLAFFVDVGQAAMRWSELKPAVGLGAGLRYRSPIGPVKLDLAWGQEVQRWRLHLTVGTEFQP